MVRNVEQDEPAVMIVGPSCPESPRIENRVLESLRASLEEEITPEIKELLFESPRELRKMLKPKVKPREPREDKENEQGLEIVIVLD